MGKAPKLETALPIRRMRALMAEGLTPTEAGRRLGLTNRQVRHIAATYGVHSSLEVLSAARRTTGMAGNRSPLRAMRRRA